MRGLQKAPCQFRLGPSGFSTGRPADLYGAKIGPGRWAGFQPPPPPEFSSVGRKQLPSRGSKHSPTSHWRSGEAHTVHTHDGSAPLSPFRAALTWLPLHGPASSISPGATIQPCHSRPRVASPPASEPRPRSLAVAVAPFGRLVTLPAAPPHEAISLGQPVSCAQKSQGCVLALG